MPYHSKLTEEEIEAVEKEKKRLFPRIIECFQSESYVDGLNDACRVFLLVSLNDRPLVEVTQGLTVETVEWFHDEIIPNAGEDKEMRINQAIFFCYILYPYPRVFWKTISRNIFPLIADLSLPPEQTVFNIGKRLYDLSQSKEVRNREIHFSSELYFLLTIRTLKRSCPESGLDKIYRDCF